MDGWDKKRGIQTVFIHICTIFELKPMVLGIIYFETDMIRNAAKYSVRSTTVVLVLY
jgi:hypothetical protein